MLVTGPMKVPQSPLHLLCKYNCCYRKLLFQVVTVDTAHINYSSFKIGGVPFILISLTLLHLFKSHNVESQSYLLTVPHMLCALSLTPTEWITIVQHWTQRSFTTQRDESCNAASAESPKEPWERNIQTYPQQADTQSGKCSFPAFLSTLLWPA